MALSPGPVELEAWPGGGGGGWSCFHQCYPCGVSARMEEDRVRHMAKVSARASTTLGSQSGGLQVQVIPECGHSPGPAGGP